MVSDYVLGQWHHENERSSVVLTEHSLQGIQACFRHLAGQRGEECNLSELVEQLYWTPEAWVLGPEEALRLRGILRHVDGRDNRDIYVTWPQVLNRLEKASGACYVRKHGFLSHEKAAQYSLRARLAPELSAVSSAIAALGQSATSPGKGKAKAAVAPELDHYRSLLAATAGDDYKPPQRKADPLDVNWEAELLEATRNLERMSLQRRNVQERTGLVKSQAVVENGAVAASSAANSAAAAGASSAGAQRGAPESKGMTAREVSDMVGLRMRLEELRLQQIEQEKEKVADDLEARLAKRRQPLTREQNAKVDAALAGNKNEVLFTLFNATITREKFRCLYPLTWLNDEVINLYVQLLAQRDKDRCAQDKARRPSHFFSSFFLDKLDGQSGYNYAGVKRWTRKAKVDVFAMDKVFVPVNISNMHWCMAVLYMQQKRVCYFDSMGGAGKRYCEALLLWLEDESEDKRGERISTDDWKIVPTPRGTPQQENGCDCGVFSLTFCDYLSDDLPLAFSQSDMPVMRRRIAYSLLQGHYIDDS